MTAAIPKVLPDFVRLLRLYVGDARTEAVLKQTLCDTICSTYKQFHDIVASRVDGAASLPTVAAVRQQLDAFLSSPPAPTSHPAQPAQ